MVNELPEDYVLQVIVAVGLRLNYMATARRHMPVAGVRAHIDCKSGQSGLVTWRSASCVLS
jgi:hypothetical protein